jgi:chromosome segregation ATPase
MSRLDIRDNLREDERRQRDEARLGAIEAQLEELRNLLREQGSRQARADEVDKGLEAALAQLGQRLDAQRDAAVQRDDARQLDITRVRQSLEELTEQIAAGIRPIPGLQAQVADVVDQVRTKFQDLTREHHRFDELQRQIDELPPQIDRNAELAYGFRDELGGLRREIEEARAQVQRAVDTSLVTEQDVRRRVGEVQAAIDTANARIDAVRDELPPLDVQIDRVRHELHQALPGFQTLEAVDRELREEIERVAVADFEHQTRALARAEQVREAVLERIQEVERLNDTRFASTMVRFRELEDADRHLAHRLTLLAVRLEELRDEDVAVRQEIRRLEELRLRLRLDQAQQEIIAFQDDLARLAAGRRDEPEDDDA